MSSNVLYYKICGRIYAPFQTGAETFISWMTGIVPVVLMLMVAMNTLIAFLGEERVTKVAKLSAKNPVTRYLVLPFYPLLC